MAPNDSNDSKFVKHPGSNQRLELPKKMADGRWCSFSNGVIFSFHVNIPGCYLDLWPWNFYDCWCLRSILRLTSHVGLNTTLVNQFRCKQHISFFSLHWRFRFNIRNWSHLFFHVFTYVYIYIFTVYKYEWINSAYLWTKNSFRCLKRHVWHRLFRQSYIARHFWLTSPDPPRVEECQKARLRVCGGAGGKSAGLSARTPNEWEKHPPTG